MFYLLSYSTHFLFMVIYYGKEYSDKLKYFLPSIKYMPKYDISFKRQVPLGSLSFVNKHHNAF